MVNNPNTIFTEANKTVKAPATLEEWVAQYERCVETFGKNSRELAGLFAAAGRMGFPLEYVPSVINLYAVPVPASIKDSITAYEVNEYLKSHPALMELRYVDGKVNTFYPFLMAGVAFTVYAATGEEPSVYDFPIQDGQDIMSLYHWAILWCYGPDAYDKIQKYYEGGAAQ